MARNACEIQGAEAGCDRMNRGFSSGGARPMILAHHKNIRPEERYTDELRLAGQAFAPAWADSPCALSPNIKYGSEWWLPIRSIHCILRTHIPAKAYPALDAGGRRVADPEMRK